MKDEEVRDRLRTFATKNSGLENLLADPYGEEITHRLARLETEPLSNVQLNQLLVFQRERAVSYGFFRYYWFSNNVTLYKLSSVPGYSNAYESLDEIASIEQFCFGLYRIYYDALLHRGNIRRYYREFCDKSESQINEFISSKRIQTEEIKRRGPSLPLEKIARDDRYLISEMACKSYETTSEDSLFALLHSAWQQHSRARGGRISIRALIEAPPENQTSGNQAAFRFSADELLDDEVATEDELVSRYDSIKKRFMGARNSALKNTRMYLSLVNDLDVYVATSMRKRDDFRQMSDRCSQIFGDHRVSDLHLRYFDPTMSAAAGHHDKGITECLMVKCCKVLVYCAGTSDSYGKDAEAAMALSLGKPVIFLCDEETRKVFYNDIHPLSRLIDFQTGVATGAMVTSNILQIPELLDRIFENEMEYVLDQRAGEAGYLQLKEKLTGSIVRLQTNDVLLSDTFWNYYGSASANSING